MHATQCHTIFSFQTWTPSIFIHVKLLSVFIHFTLLFTPRLLFLFIWISSFVFVSRKEQIFSKLECSQMRCVFDLRRFYFWIWKLSLRFFLSLNTFIMRELSCKHTIRMCCLSVFEYVCMWAYNVCVCVLLSSWEYIIIKLYQNYFNVKLWTFIICCREYIFISSNHKQIKSVRSSFTHAILISNAWFSLLKLCGNGKKTFL